MVMDIQSEADLWAGARSGDGRAFTALFDQYQRAVFRSVRRLGASHHEAEDALAAAFLEPWRRRDDVELVNGSVYPWLVVAALNAHRNRVRTAVRYRLVLRRLHGEDTAADPQAIAEDRLTERQRSVAVRRALTRMSRADAALVVLVDLEGQDQGDAARLLGLRPGTLRTRLHRARARLRSELVSDRPDLFAQEEEA